MTLDLNGQVAVRAKAAGPEAKPTEVVLTNSRCSGEPIRININRTYLQRAMRLGLSDLCLYGDDSALLGQSDDRKFVWMPLEPDSAIQPARRRPSASNRPRARSLLPIPQPVTPKESSAHERTDNQHERQGRKQRPSRNQRPGQDRHHARKASRRKASQQDLAALIDQAVEFRTALHGLMQEANGLVKALKQHRRKNKAIQTTLDSLKQLKTLGV